MEVRKIITLLGLCLLGLLLSACGDMQTGMDYLMTGNTGGQSSSGATDYRSMAYQDAINAEINPDLYVKQINQESGFNPNAYSSAGAIGIAQIVKSTADEWKVNPWDPVASLDVAAQHMHWYYAYYGYNYTKALAAYNAGMSNVSTAEANCEYWENCLPGETQQYIKVIMG